MSIMLHIIMAIGLIVSGVIMGILVGIDILNETALLLIGPMIMFGCFMLAIAHVRRRFTTDK